MQVYVLTAGYYDELVILGVFASREGAERAVAEYKANGQYHGWFFEISHQTLED